jgi:hypothetical protein
MPTRKRLPQPAAVRYAQQVRSSRVGPFAGVMQPAVTRCYGNQGTCACGRFTHANAACSLPYRLVRASQVILGAESILPNEGRSLRLGAVGLI